MRSYEHQRRAARWKHFLRRRCRAHLSCCDRRAVSSHVAKLSRLVTRETQNFAKMRTSPLRRIANGVDMRAQGQGKPARKARRACNSLRPLRLRGMLVVGSGHACSMNLEGRTSRTRSPVYDFVPTSNAYALMHESTTTSTDRSNHLTYFRIHIALLLYHPCSLSRKNKTLPLSVCCLLLLLLVWAGFYLWRSIRFYEHLLLLLCSSNWTVAPLGEGRKNSPINKTTNMQLETILKHFFIFAPPTASLGLSRSRWI